VSYHVIAHIAPKPGGIEIVALCGTTKMSDGNMYDTFTTFPMYGGECRACWAAWLSGYQDTMRKARAQIHEMDEVEARVEDVDRMGRALEAARRLDGSHGA
jgi:hypothetical protein